MNNSYQMPLSATPLKSNGTHVIVSFSKYAQHPLTDKNRNLDLNKSSALYDVNKLREKINYCNLIKSHAPVACVTLEQNKNNLFKKPLFVDLTKDENSFKTPSMVDLTKDEKAEDNRKSILKNEKSRKSILELSREGDTNGALKNITIRRKNVSPVTKHTEWIHNLNKRFDQSGLQKKLKINDEKLRAQVLSDKNKVFDEIINERLLKQLQIKEVIDLVEEKPLEVETVLPEFTPEEDAKINKAMRSPSQEQIIQKFGYNITGACLYSLSGLNWLNDNVINFYMKLLTQRGAEPGNLKVHAMDSFFLVNLRTRGYSSVRRWTRKVDIFSFDLMPIPVHVSGVHWCMLIIDFKHKTIKYYDSMGGSNKGVLDMAENYLKEESLDKKKVTLDTSTWTKETVKDIPQQMNGCDCGVFSCMFAEYICRGAKINFSQNDMKYFRRKMCLEIVNGKLLT
ncbi:sentrin-specific protease 1-like [Ctenocephalides felis]|uniref:sentrin-specific protease 1-like n=1 Tax=Ctenocephalides felis TaxID=7515 RepID=UPI000E6E18C5|nr:sentrin-specific protease 1-like [Ctenocephalides felis]